MPNTAPSNAVLALLRSRKFWLTIAGIATIVANQAAGKPLDSSAVWSIVAAISALVLGIAHEDNGANQAPPALSENVFGTIATLDTSEKKTPPQGLAALIKADKGAGSLGGIAAGLVLAALVLGPIAALASGCTAQQARTVAQDALTATEIACIFTSEISDSAALAEACHIEHALEPLVRELIGQREAAKRAGVAFHPPALDAGAGQ